MRTRGLQAWLLAGAMLAVLIGGVFLAMQHWFPIVATHHGEGVQHMLNYTLAVTGTLFVAGHIVLAWLIARSRAPRAAASAPASPRTERLVGLLPALAMALVAEGGVLLLGLPVWAKYYGPPPADALRVEVVARQFFWIIRYPGADGRFGRTAPQLMTPENQLGLDRDDPDAADDVVALNEMHVPAGRAVRVLLRSTDVIHSFNVPELRVKQNAVPGMAIEVWFTPTRAGRYELACNQICGLGHYRMRGFLEVSDEAAFRAWLAAQSPS